MYRMMLFTILLFFNNNDYYVMLPYATEVNNLKNNKMRYLHYNNY